MTTLKPCPFCGGDAAVCDVKEPSVNGWVGCQRCRCFIDWVKNGKSLAIAAWNRRAQPENEPLVRCGECIVPIADCPCGDVVMLKTDFCSYGKRKPERSE